MTIHQTEYGTFDDTQPQYWHKAMANIDKMPHIKLHVSYKVLDMLVSKGKDILLSYDAKFIDASKLPKTKPRFYADETEPLLVLIDVINNKVILADNLRTYIIRKQDYLYTNKWDYTLLPLLCKRSHKSTHMTGAEGMVFCETCGYILTEDDIKKL